MPELKMLKVVVGDMYKNGVMIGDQVTLMNRREGVVETAAEKQSYVYYTLTNGEKGRLPIGHEVTVMREVPTEEEDAAEQLRRFAKKMRQYHDHSFKSMDDSVEVLYSQYKAARAKGNYQPFNFDKSATIAREQERAGIWATVVANVEKHEELTPDVRWLRAVLAMRQYAREALTSRYRNTLSRSTSLTSNVQEDLRLDAWSEFLSDTDHWPYNQMVGVYLPGFEIKEV